MKLFFLVFLLICTTEAKPASSPYVLDEASNFSLCLGNTPSKTLRSSLLMCRELSYSFCVNSSLIGSVLKSEGAQAAHFLATLDDPTERNVEKLAWLIDSALVLLYDAFSEHRSAKVECAHEWRSWVCSRAFMRVDDLSERPYPLCEDVCLRAQKACNAQLQCPVQPDKKQCTDFFRDSGEACGKAAAAATLETRNVPVFKKRRSDDSPSSAASILHANFFLFLVVMFISFGIR